MKQRIALVTGGTRGIGGAISRALYDAGYKVAATYASRDDAAKSFSKETGIAVYKWNIADFHECQQHREQDRRRLHHAQRRVVTTPAQQNAGAVR